MPWQAVQHGNGDPLLLRGICGVDLGARSLSDLDMGAYYAEACSWAVQALESLGRYDEARRMGEDCMALADQVLERRPGYRLALHAQGILAGVLASVE